MEHEHVNNVDKPERCVTQGVNAEGGRSMKWTERWAK